MERLHLLPHRAGGCMDDVMLMVFLMMLVVLVTPEHVPHKQAHCNSSNHPNSKH